MNPTYLTLLLFVISTAMQVGGLQSRMLAFALWFATIAMLLYALSRWTQWPRCFRWTFSSVRAMRFGSRIPLPEAARIAYEEARLSGSIWAHAAERLAADKTPAGILDYIAMRFAMDADMWGRRPPSTRVELINRKEATYGAFRGGAKELRLRDKSCTVFTDLKVARSDLRAVVENFREGLKTDTPI